MIGFVQMPAHSVVARASFVIKQITKIRDAERRRIAAKTAERREFWRRFFPFLRPIDVESEVKELEGLGYHCWANLIEMDALYSAEMLKCAAEQAPGSSILVSVENFEVLGRFS